MAIRKFSRDALSAAALVRMGSLSAPAARFLETAVRLKKNVLVAGGTGSGKTSLLAALAAALPPEERIVVIEDSSELQLPQPHVVKLEARPPDASGEGAVTMRELLRATLRLRPDRIVVGEVRGGEALDLVQAMTSGHGGGLSTVHATRPADALRRIETLALMSDVALPLPALRAQVASAIDLVVQIERMADGSRRVTEVAEVRGLAPDTTYLLEPLFRFEFAARAGDDARKVRGTLVPTGTSPRFLREIAARGERLDPELAQIWAGGTR
jgi:pilus assembly protein CpaF